MTAWRRTSVLWLAVATLALAATFTRPTLRMTQPTYRYVMVFDISQSMNVSDVTLDDNPLARLAFAKTRALTALTALPCGSEAGLALFTGHRAFLLITPIEVCGNYRELATIIDNISWKMSWEARSEVAKGLYKSINLLAQLPAKTRLVFFTDGHEAPPINPEVVPQFTDEPGEIAGLVVGVGGLNPAPIPKFDKHGEPSGVWRAQDLPSAHMTLAVDTASEAQSSLRESYLQSLAEKTGLGYLRLGSADEFARRLQAPEFGIPKEVDADSRGWFGMLALITSVVSCFQGRSRRRANWDWISRRPSAIT